jgi:hypothetical protein
MNALLPEFSLVYGLLLLAVVLPVAIVGLRVVRRRRRLARRVVEKPNSHYTSAGVRSIETYNRWRDMDLDRVHEINRGEVVRLLARVDALGTEALRPAERTFMDTMADLFGRQPQGERGVEPRGAGQRGDSQRPPSDLRPRSA